MVANLSRFAQHAELDLSALAGMTPVELFGRSPFPKIGAGGSSEGYSGGYRITLSPHGFLWFSLVQDPAQIERRQRRQAPSERAAEPPPVPVLAIEGPWESCLAGKCKGDLESALLDVLPSRRWFSGTSRTPRTLRGVEIQEVIPVGSGAVLTLLGVDYTDAEPEVYVLPLAFAPETSPDLLERLREAGPAVAVAWLESSTLGGLGGLGDSAGTGLLYDPLGEPGFSRELLQAIESGQRFRGQRSELAATASPILPDLRGTGPLDPSPLPAGPGHTSVRFGDRLVLKLFRKVEPGINPDLEIGRYLSEQAVFRHVPRVAGALEIRERRAEPVTLGILQEFIANEGNAWSYTRDALGRYFDRVVTSWGDSVAAVPTEPLAVLAQREMSADDFERLGIYVPTVRLLGERTAELHVALAAGRGPGLPAGALLRAVPAVAV